MSNIKLKIDILQAYAIQKGGILLSTEYIDTFSKVLWRCKMGHEWRASWHNVGHGNTWCPKCCNNNILHTVDRLQKHANSKSGQLLSIEYTNCKKLLLWQCKKGHQWQASWDNVSRGKWCPYCVFAKTEYTVKNLLEDKLGIPFTKKRFYYLASRFELDGYNEEYKIAFEYQGYQHYIFPNRFHKTKDIFDAAQQRDIDKVTYCRNNNIRLIIVPYTEEKNLDYFIELYLHRLGLL